MTSLDPRTPVIVGAAQLSPADGAPGGPIALAVDALRLAAQDTGTGERLVRRADVVGHVATVCWLYTNETALIARELRIPTCDTEWRDRAAASADGDGELLRAREGRGLHGSALL